MQTQPENTFHIEGPCFERAVLPFGGRSSKQKVGGFFIVNGLGRRIHAYSSDRKWTPELEARLRAKAEAWAATLNERYAGH